MCVSLLVLSLLFRVGFFLELFRRNWCNKDLVFSWCSDLTAPGLTLFSPAPPAPSGTPCTGAAGLVHPQLTQARGAASQGPGDTHVAPQPRLPAGLPAFLSAWEGKPLADSLLQKLRPADHLPKQTESCQSIGRLGLRECAISDFKAPEEIF